MNEAEYIAHINEYTGKSQSVKEHCENTAERAKEIAIDDFKPLAFAAGLFHDVGKYQQGFQNRIRGISHKPIEHSGGGAAVIQEMFGKGKLADAVAALMMEYCILGHHSGIPDGGSQADAETAPTLSKRLQRKFENYDRYKEELTLSENYDLNSEKIFNNLIEGCDNGRFYTDLILNKAFIFTNYLFSCLTDADWLDTAEFCKSKDDDTGRSLEADFTECLKRIDNRLEGFKNIENPTELQKARSVVQTQVFSRTNEDSEIYLMNMPTGSGKTLTSMKFALERAIAKGKARIIYVIPFNSIIEQTAADFEKMFNGCAQILRHQSTFSIDDMDDTEENYRKTYKYAAENWDAQIIITTAVQFFESLYSNKRAKCRKLHNIANSIIVFDEVHLMPRDYLQPCLRAVSTLTKYFNCEAVFLTATMPDFRDLIDKYGIKSNKILDLVEDTSAFESFKKCEFKYLSEPLSMEGLVSRISSEPTSLIIVNSRKTAREVYRAFENVRDKEKLFHLSTYMTAKHRESVIAEIRSKLQELNDKYENLENVPEDERVTVVSTSLIEAGVDLDFFTVYRELNGLDSILQSGGRCNREGRRSGAVTYVFKLEGKRPPQGDGRILITSNILSEFEDISSADAIRHYYNELYEFNCDGIIRNDIAGCMGIENGKIRAKPKPLHETLSSLPFCTYARSFNIIEDNSCSVVFADDAESRSLIWQMEEKGFCNSRKLRKYAFSVSQDDLDFLKGQGLIKGEDIGILYITDENAYDEMGIKLEPICYIL